METAKEAQETSKDITLQDIIVFLKGNYIRITLRA